MKDNEKRKYKGLAGVEDEDLLWYHLYGSSFFVAVVFRQSIKLYFLGHSNQKIYISFEVSLQKLFSLTK